MDILDKYIEELKEDLRIDEFSIKDASLKSPGRKHYWTSRLIYHKRNLMKLENEKNTLIKKASQEIQYQSPVKVSNVAIEKSAQDVQIVKDINFKINDEKLIIEFLEKTEKTLSSLTYDIKNIIEIIKLETL